MCVHVCVSSFGVTIEFLFCEHPVLDAILKIELLTHLY